MTREEIKILLVEDNPDDVKITQRAFKKNRLTNGLWVVRDGQEALDFLYHRGEYTDESKAPRPGLILLDINMPRMDGIEVLKRLKGDPKFKRIPVVMLTVSERDEDIIRSYDLGVNSYIVKPVEFSKFVEAIKCFYFYWTVTAELPWR